jgi:hypothetical protein
MGPRARLEDGDKLQDVMAETPVAGVVRLPRASDLRGSGLSNAPPIGVLGHGSGALLGGVRARPATSPSPAPAADAPSASADGSSQAVPLVSTPAGLALGEAAYRVHDQVFGKSLSRKAGSGASGGVSPLSGGLSAAKMGADAPARPLCLTRNDCFVARFGPTHRRAQHPRRARRRQVASPNVLMWGRRRGR